MSIVKLDGAAYEHPTKAVATSRVVSTEGAVVGEIEEVRDHPNGQRIWLARVNLGKNAPIWIVFGGTRELEPADLVPVAQPGTWVTVQHDRLILPRRKKMRNRQYRGQRSHGMLCSLVELGWAVEGPDEVALLRGLPVGFGLDDIPAHDRTSHVVYTKTLAHR